MLDLHYELQATVQCADLLLGPPFAFKAYTCKNNLAKQIKVQFEKGYHNKWIK